MSATSLVPAAGHRAAAALAIRTANHRAAGQSVSDRALTGIESSARSSRSCAGDRPSVVR